MKNRKHILGKLMALNNEEANKQLAKFADEIKKEIFVADDNDKIFDDLDLLEEFLYKVPKESIEIINYLIHHPLPHKMIEGPVVTIEGKKYKEIVKKALELLNLIRYIAPNEVLPILAELGRGEDEDIKNKALEVLKNFAKYDYLLLTKTDIGYGAQRKVLDFMLAWPLAERQKNLDFIETASRLLLGSSVESANATAVDQITFHSGAVGPTPFLKKIRRETIDLVCELYWSINDEKKKLRIVKILEEAIRTPMSVAYGDDLAEMIADDGKYLLEMYRKMLFNRKGDLVASFAVADEIEKRLYWFHRREKLNTPEAEKLRADLLGDKAYGRFRILAGDNMTYLQEGNFQDEEKKHEDLVGDLVKEVNKDNLEQWINDLNQIASQLGLVAEWQFRYFKIFLKDLTVANPEISKAIFNDAYINGKPLKQFIANYLDGLRKIDALDIWDEAITQIAEQRDSFSVSAIVFSLNYDQVVGVDLKNVVREKDLEILQEIVKERSQFAFLKNNEERNYLLHHALIHTLMNLYRLNHAKIEELIIDELGQKDYANIFIRALNFGVLKGWIDYSQFSEKGIEGLKKWMIEIPELDWEVQAVLLNLGKENIQPILDVFWGRIEKDHKRRDGKLVLAERVQYRAIPYNFNESLAKYLAEYPDLSKMIQPWLGKATDNWSTYNWEIGQFIKGIGYPLREVVRSLIKKRDDKLLLKIVNLMNPVDGGDMDFCMEIASITTNKKILSHLQSILYSTGVVSGEDGIARAYEGKANALEPYLKNGNANAKKFAKEVISNLLESAKLQRKRAAEDKKLREIEFRG